MDILEKAERLTPERLRTVKPIDDQYGQVAWDMFNGEDRFILVAKEYAHKGRASFMLELVEMAESANAKLLFYDDNTGDFTVFDPAHYQQNGTRSVGDSKRGDDVVWIERPLADGVSLENYLFNDRQPRRMSEDNTELAKWQ